MNSACICLHCALGPVNVVVHRDDALLEMERMHFVLVDRHLLDFFEELSCCTSWVNPPLEHDWLPGDVKEFAMWNTFDKI